MRIKNKYNRNRAFRVKYWKCIRHKSHPYETFCPYNNWGHHSWEYEDQVKRHFDWIAEQARYLESGNHRGTFHAPRDFRRVVDSSKKAKVRTAMQKIRNGDYDIEIPTFKKDADWLWF